MLEKGDVVARFFPREVGFSADNQMASFEVIQCSDDLN